MTFDLPQRESPSSHPAALVSRGVRILFVDDDDGVRRAFARTLRERGFTVDVAGSAIDAIRLAQQQLYAVIVTDLRMPGMDGLSLIDRLRDELPSTAFVLVTGVAEVDVHRIDEMGDAVMSIIAKPWNVEQLVTTANRAIQLHGRRFMARMNEHAAPQRSTILLVEDDPCDAEIVTAYLQWDSDAYQVTQVDALGDALELLHKNSYDAIIADLSLPDARGLDAVHRLHKAAPEVALLVLSGTENETLALESVRHGAQDYLVKGKMNATEVLRSLRYARERKHAERQLAHLAHFDQLTGLANRRTLHDRLAQLLARARRQSAKFAVMFLDLDHFKAINDTLGHHAGDILLQHVAIRLQAAVRDYDTVARMGGDEFAILLDEFDDDETPMVVGERILAAMAAPFDILDRPLHVSTSIGVAVFPAAGATETELVKCADSAMYVAKKHGRNQMHIFKRSTSSPGVEIDLRKALSRNELVLHYQPIFNASTRRVVSFEALLRWRRGDTLVPPAQFIPDLERSGHIKEVGEWVSQEACAQLARWRAQGGDPTTRVSVNLSARQFEDDALLTAIQGALARSGLEPGALELEITESILMRDTSRTNRLLQELKALGVRLAIDDFGTGYSSLAYLRRFAVDTLKVDGSFVSNLQTSESDEAIVSAIIGLGHRLGLEVVAEGVETAEQLIMLVEQDCDLVQGYHLGLPKQTMCLPDGHIAAA